MLRRLGRRRQLLPSLRAADRRFPARESPADSHHRAEERLDAESRRCAGDVVRGAWPIGSAHAVAEPKLLNDVEDRADGRHGGNYRFGRVPAVVLSLPGA